MCICVFTLIVCVCVSISVLSTPISTHNGPGGPDRPPRPVQSDHEARRHRDRDLQGRTARPHGLSQVAEERVLQADALNHRDSQQEQAQAKRQRH